MISLKDGVPFAKIVQGDYKGELLFVDADLKSSGAHYNEVKLGKNKLVPILNDKQRQVAYIGGPAGSGKSYYAASLAHSFKKMYPERDIYFFSRTPVEEDPAYAKLQPIQVDIESVLRENPIESEDIAKGSLVIFDDVMTLVDPVLQKAVKHLMNDIMQVGRKMGLYIIITNHLLNPEDRTFGRHVLNEMQSLTIFPGGSFSQINYILKTNLGLSGKEIEQIRTLNSRWVTITTHYPRIVFYEHGAYVLGKSEAD